MSFSMNAFSTGVVVARARGLPQPVSTRLGIFAGTMGGNDPQGAIPVALVLTRLFKSRLRVLEHAPTEDAPKDKPADEEIAKAIEGVWDSVKEVSAQVENMQAEQSKLGARVEALEKQSAATVPSGTKPTTRSKT